MKSDKHDEVGCVDGEKEEDWGIFGRGVFLVYYISFFFDLID